MFTIKTSFANTTYLGVGIFFRCVCLNSCMYVCDHACAWCTQSSHKKVSETLELELGGCEQPGVGPGKPARTQDPLNEPQML